MNKNEKNVKLFKQIRTSNNSPMNKSPKIGITYYKKKITNNKKTHENEQVNSNNNLTHKRNNFIENFNKKLFNNSENNQENKKIDSKINNKVINININYNDKYNYYDNYQMDIKDKNEHLNFNILNYDKKLKPKLSTTKKNNILEINLNSMNNSKNKIKIPLTCKNTISPKPDIFYFNDSDINNNKCSMKIKKIKDNNNRINSLKSKFVKINNINNKKYIIINNNKNKNENELINKISNIIKDKNIILFLNEKNKVETRKKGFSLLNEFILNKSNSDIIKDNINDILIFIYYKLNYFQEKNIILLTEGLYCILHIFEYILNNKNIYDKKMIDINKIVIIIDNLKEKINNIKIKNIFFKLLSIFIKLFSTEKIFEILFKNLSISSNNITILKEYLLFIKKTLENIIMNSKTNKQRINIKSLLDFLIQVLNLENNPEIKLLSIKIICLLYKIYGKIVKEYLKENNEVIFEIVEKEIKLLENNNIINNNQIKNDIIGQSKSLMIKDKKDFQTKKKKINNNNLRKDISKSITPKLISELSSDNFISNKNAIDYINKLILKYKKISIYGLKNIFFVIKNKLNDIKEETTFIFVDLLYNLISSLGKQIKIYSNILFFPLLLNLSNKSQEIREKSFNCLEKWIKELGLNDISIYLPEILNNENNNINMKLEVLKLLLSNYNLIECYYDKTFTLNLCKSLINCLLNNSLIIRNNTEKLIKKFHNIIQKELYIEEINNRNFGIQEKDYLYKKIDILFLNCNYINNVNKNSIILNNFNKAHKQNSFNNSNHFILLSEISCESNNNENKYIDKNKIHFKQKILEGRNKSIFSNNSITAINLKSHTLSLNYSTDQLNKKRKKTSLVINGNSINSFINTRNKSPHFMKISNNYINSNRISNNNSLPIKRKRTETEKFNKLMFSSIISPSKIKKKLQFDDNSKLLPDNIKQEIKKLKTMQNLDNKRKNYKKLIVSEKKKKISNILNINNNDNTTPPPNKNNYFTEVVANEINFKKNLFNENYETYIFSTNYKVNNKNPKKAKEIRYENDKKINFDIKVITDIENIQSLRKFSENIFSFDFIQKIFNNNVEDIIFYLSKLNKLIDNSILNNDKDIFGKIIDNLDILLKILSFILYKYNNDSLSKSFFILTYSIVELSKTTKYIFNETEITILLNILCNKLNNNKKIIKETSYNLIIFLSERCENKTFLIILSKLLKYQEYQIIPETIEIIQNLCEKYKYNKDIISEILEEISKLYFYNFYKYDYIKDKYLLPLLINIFDSIGNKFWEKCIFLSKEKKEILSKKIFEFKNMKKQVNIENIDENDKDLLIKILLCLLIRRIIIIIFILIIKLKLMNHLKRKLRKLDL